MFMPVLEPEQTRKKGASGQKNTPERLFGGEMNQPRHQPMPKADRAMTLRRCSACGVMLVNTMET